MTASADPPAESPREAATNVARRLLQRGHLALFAGGCVRDLLRGANPSDFDVATSATPDEIRSAFPHARGVGEAFGVMLVRRRGHTVEVATFRSDGRYSDGRRPDEVTFGTPEQDARRRDFTINALFEHPLTGEVIDHVNGRADLNAGVVRCVGDPEERLREDRLRMIRAVRFAARFEFVIDPETARVIHDGAARLRGVSRERIGQELRRMLLDPARGRAAALLEALELDGVMLEEDRGAAGFGRLASLPAATTIPTALAAWLLDRHPGATTADRTAVLRRWSSALILSNAESNRTEAILDARARLLQWAALTVARKKRLASSIGFAGALAIRRVERPEAASIVAADVRELSVTGLAPAPFIDGDALVRELSMAPGPIFREVLEQVYDAQLEGRITDRAAALDLARRIAADADN